MTTTKKKKIASFQPYSSVILTRMIRLKCMSNFVSYVSFSSILTSIYRQNNGVTKEEANGQLSISFTGLPIAILHR